jgi:carotenoid cleavage dioxygenase
VRWASVNPCYVFHVANAFEAGGKITIDVSRYPELWRAKAEAFDASAQLWRWELDLASMRVTETLVDDRAMEFPTINPARTGLSNRVIFAASDGQVGSAGTDFDRILRYDTVSGATVERVFADRALVSEFAFAAGGAGEDEGWVMGFVYDRARGASDFVILDAQDLNETARIRLPRRVPQGFHGAWVPGV